LALGRRGRNRGEVADAVIEAQRMGQQQRTCLVILPCPLSRWEREPRAFAALCRPGARVGDDQAAVARQKRLYAHLLKPSSGQEGTQFCTTIDLSVL